MKIAVLVPTIKPGGAEKQAALLAVALSQKHEVHFISFYGVKGQSEIVKGFLESGNVRIYYLTGSFLKKIKSLYLLLISRKIEIAFNYLTFCDVIGAVVERSAKVKTIYNGIRNSKLAASKMIMELLVHNFIADYTIYNCYSGAKYFEKRGFINKKTIVIPNCFPDISVPIYRENKETKRIITIGRFETQKDYLTAIKSISKLNEKRTDFKFIIIGHGNLEKRIRTWIEEYHILKCTNVYIAPNNVQEILKASDIYLSTSLFEGTSNSLMEAMNWSIPIVATNVGDNNALVVDGENGFLTDIKDYNTIVRKLELLLDDYQLRLSMGIRGNRRLHNYSSEIFEQNYAKIINLNK